MNRQIRILIVEDEEAIREGLIDVLVFHGYTVDSAATGPAGLDKARSGKFDLVLLDIMLPGMDGYEICDRIRKEDRDLAIIMLTAKTSDEEIIEGRNRVLMTTSRNPFPSSNWCFALKQSCDGPRPASNRPGPYSLALWSSTPKICPLRVSTGKSPLRGEKSTFSATWHRITIDRFPGMNYF